jgi:hypothetical protein
VFRLYSRGAEKKWIGLGARCQQPVVRKNVVVLHWSSIGKAQIDLGQNISVWTNECYVALLVQIFLVCNALPYKVGAMTHVDLKVREDEHRSVDSGRQAQATYPD